MLSFHYSSKNFSEHGPDVQIAGRVRGWPSGSGGQSQIAIGLNMPEVPLAFDSAIVNDCDLCGCVRNFLRVQPEYPGSLMGFLYSVLIPWMAFSEAILKGSTSILRSRQYLRKLNVSEMIFSVESFLHAFISLSVGYLGVIILGLIEGVSIQWSWLALPPVFLLMIACGSGIGLFFAVLVPFFTDLTHAVQIGVRPMFWLTPVIYPITQVGDGFLYQVVSAQPSTPFVLAIRQVYFDGVFPSASTGWQCLCGPFVR